MIDWKKTLNWPWIIDWKGLEFFGSSGAGTLTYQTFSTSFDSYSTLAFGAGVLPPCAEASSGPNAHPVLTTTLQKPAVFCRPEKCAPMLLVQGHLVLRDAFQTIHIVSWRWLNSCLKDAGWCLPLYRVDTEDHPFSLTRWYVDSMCCAQSEGQLIILSPSWTVVQHTVWVVCWLLA